MVAGIYNKIMTIKISKKERDVMVELLAIGIQRLEELKRVANKEELIVLEESIQIAKSMVYIMNNDGKLL